MLIAKQIVSALLLPPALPLLFAGLGLYMMRKRWHSNKGFVLTVLMLGLLWLISCEAIARMAYRDVERDWQVWDAAHYADKPAQAIVVLGGGGERGAAEWGGYTLNPRSTVRLIYALKLSRETQLPVLFSGGNADPGTPRDDTEGAAAGRMLQAALGTELRWIETQSRDTRENAQYSAQMLQPRSAQGIRRIVLVTHVWHMQRAQRYFEREGFEVQAAPMGFIGGAETTPREWLPSADGLLMTRHLWREKLGTWAQKLSE